MPSPTPPSRPSPPAAADAAAEEHPAATVTVVLPTFRRPAGLARALRALADQQDPGVPWDVLVVDNDSDDTADVTAVFERCRPLLPVAASLVCEPGRGAARARNAGIQRAEGDIVAFLDDDVVPDRRWLARLVAPVVAGTADAAGGPVALDPAVSVPGWLGRDWLGYLSQYDRGTDERLLDGGDYVLTANAAFRTERLRAIHGFDEALGPRGGSPMVNDDLDLCRRWAAAGGRIAYVPGAVVVHDVPPARVTIQYVARRAYAQGRSDWLLDRRRNVRRPAGGAQGILVHLRRLLGDRVRDGLLRPDVAVGASLAVAHAAGALREAAAGKWQARGGRPIDP